MLSKITIVILSLVMLFVFIDNMDKKTAARAAAERTLVHFHNGDYNK